ncbi:adenylyl-sulfate kinase [Antrihabitans sp. YC2-6]|uniref:adenylyl-sulfate kinase n=1 Tax=Antrihabitans sp. YC2-6 TaxID=2799498 RepID=UPI0018F4A46F|nr:adenylyl-sulfate kinase [Antrihabitans sp. YC2-6]MBJ8348164.1 adenylyl-sulfate kinase [Antrihabitans sp. YC2-6]
MASQLLHVATAGSVDDGKSTLIGRLLYDSKAIFEDQLAAVERVSAERGDEHADLALLTDGLRAEREQGITIDVAYRYFATPKRKFIIADTPGHEQYTRNMVTGASTADLALILVDARKGILEQTRRHSFIASLLGIPHIVLCINKMDLVGWSQDRFEEIAEEFRQFAMKLDIHDIVFIPVSALLGDNIVSRSTNMAWYDGQSLIHHLEHAVVSSDRNLIDSRFPVQYVIRPQQQSDSVLHDFRGYAGTVAGGVFKPGDEVVALPGGFTSKVKAIWGPGGEPIEDAFAPAAVCIELTDNLDVGRGDLLCRPNNRPLVGREIDAMVCWFTDVSTLSEDSRFTMLHTTRSTRAQVTRLDYRLDVNTLHRDLDAKSLGLNQIGRVQLRVQQPLLFDPYRKNRTTGSFVLVDEATNNTVAAGMITGPTIAASNVVWHGGVVSRGERATKGATVWLTGLSASGKSSVAVELERLLVAGGHPAYRLDGDNLRHGLNADLGFGPSDRSENVRRVGAVAQLLADAGMIAVASLISPYAVDRDRVRAAHEAAGLEFVEVFIDTPIELCAQRDPKGMYAKAWAGEIKGFTGVDDPYEAPRRPEVVLRPIDGGPMEHAKRIMEFLNL